MPTVADLRARRLDLTRASLRERLLAGDFDDVRVVVESLAQEFDIVDIAAAAVKMAHAAAGRRRRRPGDPGRRAAAPEAGDGQRDRMAAPRGTGAPARRSGRGGASAVDGRGPTVRLFIGAGRQAGIRPGDLVGAITGEAGVRSRSLGAIEIADSFSLVEVPDALADGSSPR